jgi:hypothetical protein
MKTTPLWTRRDRFRFWLQQYDPWMLAGLLFVALILGSAATRHLISSWQQRTTVILITPTPPLPALPTPTVPQIEALASSAARFTTRAVIAYDDNGQPIGAIEIGRPYTPTAQIDDTWLLAEVQGSGIVRLKVAELYGLADLPRTAQPTAPPPTSPPVVIVEQVPVPAVEYAPPTYQPPPEPPTPEPTPQPTPTPPPAPTSDFAASFQEPPKSNPFIGCVTIECRKQFGQLTPTP